MATRWCSIAWIFSIDPDDRIALLGANGNGKSTFAKLIAGQARRRWQGEIVRPPKLEVGFFAQHQIEDLDTGSHSALDHRRAPLCRRNARNGCAPISAASASVRIARSCRPASSPAAKRPGSPSPFSAPAIRRSWCWTNRPITWISIRVKPLVQAINNFAGAVILISHDRHLIELTADRLWLVADGRVRPYDGDLDDYRRLLLGGPSSSTSKESRREEPPKKHDKPARRAADRHEILRRRQAARAAEKELEKLSSERASVAATLADEKTYRSLGDELDTLLKRHAELETALQRAEARWLEAEEALEVAEGR